MRAFKQFDFEHQGKISFENLKQVSRELGAPLPSTDLPTHTRAGARASASASGRGADAHTARMRTHACTPPCRREHDRRGDHGDDNSSRHRQGRHDQ